MTFDKLVQKRMFLLMILSLVFFGYFGGIQNVGISKTVGWSWDITSWLFFAKSYFLPIYIVGYGILALLKYWTHKNLSKTHLILVILTFVLDEILTIGLQLIVILNLISMIVFILNFVWAIRNRNFKMTKKASTQPRV
jgi:hypothetical protein